MQPSGEKARESTQKVLTVKDLRSCPLCTNQSFTVPSTLPVASNVLRGENAMAVIAAA